MLKNMIGAFLGAKAEQKSGHPLIGAAVGATAVAIAKRSLPVAPSASRSASPAWSCCRAIDRGRCRVFRRSTKFWATR
jgi:hypothetical protein